MKYAKKEINPQLVAPFGGQRMTCVLCGMIQKSDPDIISDWRAVQLEGSLFYACPDEFPPDGGSKEEYEAAYLRFITRALEKRQERIEQRKTITYRSVRGPNGKVRRIKNYAKN